jgi:hypothetical protein
MRQIRGLNEAMARVGTATSAQTEKLVHIGEATQDQADEAAKSGRVLMTFTIVTVIFVSPAVWGSCRRMRQIGC